MKRDVVREDEFDRGARALLNLGHTVGHADRVGQRLFDCCTARRVAAGHGDHRAGGGEKGLLPGGGRWSAS